MEEGAKVERGKRLLLLLLPLLPPLVSLVFVGRFRLISQRND